MSTLYRKYRPQNWSEVAGQNHVKVTLAFEAQTGRIAHAYLFSGPRGVGKTTIARIFAKAINCTGRPKEGNEAAMGEPCGKCPNCQIIADGRTMDIIEIDAASHRGIDNVRDNIIENARFSPSQLAFKVFVIDEVHMLTTEAFNALLKTLEEPPARTVFILATTELHKVPATIVSRCQRFEFRKIPFDELVSRLHGVAEREGCKMDRRTLEEVAHNSDGCLRDAESLLGKILALGDGKCVTYEQASVVLPRSDEALVAEFTEALLRRESTRALQVIGDCLTAGVDLDHFAGDAIESLRRVLLVKLSGHPDIHAFELDEERKKRLVEWGTLTNVAHLVSALELLLEKRREIKSSHLPQLPIELAVVRICEGLQAPAKEPKTVVAAKVTVPGAVQVRFAGTVAADKTPTETLHPSAPEKKDDSASQHLSISASEHNDNPKPQTPKSVEPVTSTEHLRSVWNNFMKLAAEENAGLPYLLSCSEPVGVNGDIVCIGFNYPFHRDKANVVKNKIMLEKALSALLGKQARIEATHLDKKLQMMHDNPAPIAVVAPQASASTAPADAILATFGGKMVS